MVEATGALPPITVVDRTAVPLRVMTVARWGDPRLPMAAVDQWAAPCRPMVVAVVRWAPTVAAVLPPMAEGVVGTRAALAEVVGATRLPRVEAVATIAVVAEAGTDAADSTLF